MRIAIEATWVQGKPTGVGMYVRELLRQYADIAPNNAYFLFHYTRNWAGPDFGPQFQPVSYRFGSAVPSILLRANRRLREIDVDVYHVTNATGVPPRPCVPVVTTVHDLYRFHAQRATNPLRDLVFRSLFRLSRRYSAHFIADSDCTREDLVNLTGIEPDRIARIYLAPIPGERPSRSAPESNAKHIICLGALEKRKNPAFFLDVYAAALQKQGDLPPVLFVGPDRGERPALAKRIGEVPALEKKVRLIPYVTDGEKDQLMQDALLAVMPSRFEGFGLPPLEAMTHGVPVLVSDIPVFREIAAGGGELVSGWDPNDWSDRLLKILNDDVYRHELAERGRRHAATFSWRKCAEQTLECYAQIMRNRPTDI